MQHSLLVCLYSCHKRQHVFLSVWALVKWLITSLLASLQLKFCFYNHHQNIRYLPNCSNYIKMHIASSLFDEINQFDKFHEEKLPVDTFFLYFLLNSLIIPWFFFKFWNSLIFSCREFVLTIFPVFPDFQTAWPPCEFGQILIEDNSWTCPVEFGQISIRGSR